MVMFLFIVVFLITAPVQTSFLQKDHHFCSYKEFACDDGACISIDRACDEVPDCSDRSDERNCYSTLGQLQHNPILQRSKRQSNCRKNQWQCRDGTCIGFDGKCDGIVDCPDRSDETHALCRKSRCRGYLFRCTYGACVDGTAPCNGQAECADASDELLPRCTNTTRDSGGRYRCDNGELIPSVNRCDGKPDCADSSDENVKACAGKTCPEYLFQCAYGACVDAGSDCNQVQDCADNSDEDDELCNRQGTTKPKPKPTAPPPTVKPNENENCVLPPYPSHGRYQVTGVDNARPGQAYDVAFLNITCDPGYGVDGNTNVYCYNGVWSQSIPKCVRFCRLNPHPSVTYECLVSGGIEGHRTCNLYEPTNTVVRPVCKAPNYYYSGVLGHMRCIDGDWDNIYRCTPECGTITPLGEGYIIDGVPAYRGELPWHAGIYRKTKPAYMQICGGTLISTTAVISAAHCFWSDIQKKLPASNYAVALGKLNRAYNDPVDDESVQKSDVADILMPARFQGAAANFQDDIAILKLTVEIEYRTYVRPVCLDFGIIFEKRQLVDGKQSKVAGWGITSENGKASQILLVVNLTYINIGECISTAPPNFREYITSDKICAGDKNGKALCKGDSGGGLVFPDTVGSGITRYYLRGIVSTAPKNDNICNRFPFTTFTQVSRHESLIKELL